MYKRVHIEDPQEAWSTYNEVAQWMLFHWAEEDQGAVTSHYPLDIAREVISKVKDEENPFEGPFISCKINHREEVSLRWDGDFTMGRRVVVGISPSGEGFLEIKTGTGFPSYFLWSLHCARKYMPDLVEDPYAKEGKEEV